MMDQETKDYLDTRQAAMMTFFENLFRSLETEMLLRFDKVDARLERIDNTLIAHGRQLGSGARSIAGLTEWVGKADADYNRVLTDLAELKLRIDKLEQGGQRP
jgi:hypothetical protein